MIDLEHFPTDGTAQRMLSRVSPIYDQSYVGKWLYQVMGLEISDARQRSEELRLQAFPETATWGLVYWEALYNIEPDPSLSISERRRQIMFRRERKAPMNPDKLAQLISGACGGVQCTIIENVNAYTFEVQIEILPSDIAESDLRKVIDKMKPSHQDYRISFALSTTCDLRVGGLLVWARNFEIRQVN